MGRSAMKGGARKGNLELEVDSDTVLVGGSGLLAVLDGASALRSEGDGDGVGELVLDGEGDGGGGSDELGLDGGLIVDSVAEGGSEGGDGGGLGGVDAELTSGLSGVLLVVQGGAGVHALGGLIEQGNEAEALAGHIAELETITGQGEGLLGKGESGGH